jgi:hypothetical protein
MEYFLVEKCSAAWTVRTNSSTAVFGLSNRSDCWISNKKFELFSKIIYSEDL